MKPTVETISRTEKAVPLRPELHKALSAVSECCTECGLCREECGFLEKYGTPKEIADRYDPASREGQAMPFECSFCRLCDAVCPVGVKPSALFLAMRRECAERGSGAFPEHNGMLAYERFGMSRRSTWYGLPEGCRTVLFPGCALPGTRPERTIQLFERLQQKIPDLGVVLDCCGKISRDLGRERFFASMFGEMTDYLWRQGVREVIVVCPNCLRIFKDCGGGLEVRIAYELISDPPAEAKGAAGASVAIHDPCGARFDRAAHDETRRLLTKTGLQVIEMEHGRENTLCCGEGGGVRVLSPKLAQRWTGRVSGEAGGKPVVTYCAGCANHLGEKTRTLHALDVLFEPDAALEGKTRVSKGLLTYWNRIGLKRRFRRIVNAAVTRERTFSAEEAKKGGWAGRLAILSFLVAAIVAVRVTGATRYLDQEMLRGLIEGYGVLAPLVYMMVYTIAPALFLPGLPITIVGGILFGPFWGVVYTITSATAGACLAFLVSRYVARDWVAGKLRSPRWRSLDEGVEKHGWKVVAFTRLIPLFPFNLLNYAFGLTKVGFWPYAVTTFICMLPACIAFIVFSSSLLDLLKGKISVNFLIGIGLVILVSLIPMFYSRYKAKKGKEDPL
jgi:uncharacterized membrane protein YdjX (TVP38/TMEM64 family)/Fe-S oxidoreductase